MTLLFKVRPLSISTTHGSSRWANKGTGYFFLEDYKPTEIWAITLEPVIDTPSVTLEVLQKLINIFQKIGMWTKGFAKSFISGKI